MHTPINATLAGEAIAENSETRTIAPTMPGLIQNSEHLNDTNLALKRKTVRDSRTEVIAKSRSARIGLKVYAASPEKIAALHAIRDSIPGTASACQRTRLLTAIQTLGSVTVFEAQRCLDIADPRPRKLELVREGHPIQLAWARTETEAGVLHRVGSYFLARDAAQEVTA